MRLRDKLVSRVGVIASPILPVVLCALLVWPASLLALEAYGGGGGSAGHTIQEEGSDLPAQPNLNFVGAGMTCANDVPNSRTECILVDQTCADPVACDLGAGTTVGTKAPCLVDGTNCPTGLGDTGPVPDCVTPTDVQQQNTACVDPVLETEIAARVVANETDAAHDTCAEISGCVVGALTSESDPQACSNAASCTVDLTGDQVTGGTASRCARFDATGKLGAATGDCSSGDTTVPDTTCVTPANCDLGSATTVGAKAICLTDGTNCPASGGGNAVQVHKSGVSKTTDVRILDFDVNEVVISDTCYGGSNDGTVCTSSGDCTGGGTCIVGGKASLGGDLDNYRRGIPVDAADVPYSCISIALTGSTVGTTPQYCNENGCSSTQADFWTVTAGGTRFEDMRCFFHTDVGASATDTAQLFTQTQAACQSGANLGLHTCGSGTASPSSCSVTGTSAAGEHVCSRIGAVDAVSDGNLYVFKISTAASTRFTCNVVKCLDVTYFP